MSRYQQAAILRALELIPKLEAAMEAAATIRAEAVDAYNQHLSTHLLAKVESRA